MERTGFWARLMARAKQVLSKPSTPQSPFSENFEAMTLFTMEGRNALAEGDAAVAYDCLSRKHELILKVFGPDAGPTGTSWIDLADALHLVGRIQEAGKPSNMRGTSTNAWSGRTPCETGSSSL